MRNVQTREGDIFIEEGVLGWGWPRGDPEGTGEA